MRRQVFLLIGIVLLVGLVIGFIWSARLDAPRDAWYQGKKVYVHVEVWEPGRDLATVGMTMPKNVLDFLRGAGIPAAVSMRGGDGPTRVEFDEFWKRLQRLEEGERITYEENGATVHIWLDRYEGRIAPSDSSGAPTADPPVERRL